MATLLDFVDAGDAKHGTCIFREQERIIWTNYKILVIDDPQLNDYFESFALDALLKDAAYRLHVVENQIQIKEVREDFLKNDLHPFINPNLHAMRLAMPSLRKVEINRRRAVGVIFDELINRFPPVHGAFYDEEQFDYLAQISTNTFSDRRGFLYFTNVEQPRGMITPLVCHEKDLEKLIP